METGFRFRAIPRREDVSEIREKCQSTTATFKEGEDEWRTLYGDTFPTRRTERLPPAKAPRPGIHIGGGNLEPEPDEMKTDYSRSFVSHADARVPRAEPMPCSQIIHEDLPFEQNSTAHAAMKEVEGYRTPQYENEEAKRRVVDAKDSHFFFGGDATPYDTTYSGDFPKRPEAKASSYDLALQKSSVTFDRTAGPGPHTKGKHRHVEEEHQLPDLPKRNHLKPSFDIGYDTLNYETTQKVTCPNRGRVARPRPAQAPECAEITPNDDEATKWSSVYEDTFHKAKPEPNPINVADLKRTNFDLGYEGGQYAREKQAVSTGRPPLEYIDTQISNVVFKGDNQGRYQTTSDDLIGRYDRDKDGRGDHVDVKEDHLFLGGDGPEYVTTTAIMNAKAGQGKPAERVQDLHLLRGATFATGGQWDPNDPSSIADEKTFGYPEPQHRGDGEYFKRSHFDIDAMGSKSHYKTTYYSTICKSKLAN